MNKLLSKTFNIFTLSNQLAKKRSALSFRKTLGVYNYKIKKDNYFKNPHAIAFKEYAKLKQTRNEINNRKINHLKANSNTPYGRFTSKGNFRVDYNRVPSYDFGNFQSTYLKPYVTKTCCRIYNREPEDLTNGEINNKVLDNIRTQLLFSNDPAIRRLGYDIFESDFGKKTISEYMKNGKTFLKPNMKDAKNRYMSNMSIQKEEDKSKTQLTSMEELKKKHIKG